MFGRDAPTHDTLGDEAGVAVPQRPGWDCASTAESSALLNTSGMSRNIPLPVTPLPHARQPQSTTPPGMTCEGNEHWKTGVRWTTGSCLGRGSNGQVIQVTSNNTNQSQQYAIKMSILGNRTSTQEIDNEATIMQATTAFLRTGRHPECQHVAPVLDSRPCLDGVLMLTGAYVTLKMEMDLQTWYEDYAQGNRVVRKRCQGTIARQLAAGLSCLHTAGTHGFMHGDFKTDNVLVESIDPKTRCPQGLRLIDFGLSHQLGSAVSKYREEFFDSAGHLPDTMFEGAPDTLNLTVESDPDMFYASSDVDWCSYVYLMNNKFHYNPIQQAFDIARVTQCGKMGVGRRLVQRLEKGVKVIEGGMDVQGDSRATWAAWSKARRAAAPRKRRREEAEEVERVVAQRVLTPSIWESAVTHLSNFAERLGNHKL